MNDYQFKVVKLKGDFIWHAHADTDETFIALDGELRIDLRDGAIVLRPGEMADVPKGVEHKPFAAEKVRISDIHRPPRASGDRATSKVFSNTQAPPA